MAKAPATRPDSKKLIKWLACPLYDLTIEWVNPAWLRDYKLEYNYTICDSPF